MSKVVKALFGGTDKTTLKAQKQANKRTQQFIEQQGGIARADVLPLAGGAFENINLGSQAALDVLGQTIPQQFGTFQAGNVGAQQNLLAGLPQFQNAILGLPTDFSGFQTQQIPVDTSFAQQQLPDFVGPQGLVPAIPEQLGFRQLSGRKPPEPTPLAQPQQIDFSQLLRGTRP